MSDVAVVNACDHVVAFALEHPWALTPEMCGVVASILARRLAGQASDPPTIAAAVASRKSGGPTLDQGVAVIPIYGVIAPRMNLLSEMSGGTTYDALTAQLHDAVAMRPKAIVFDVDSPGGNVAGATEFAREVLKARTQVPIIAQAQHLMASAAYWLSACATDIVASPSSLVGGVGVYTIHDDMSAALERLGIKRDVIAAGEYKGEGVDKGPLSEDARAHRQRLVDSVHTRMLADIAAGRGVTADTVRTTYGRGRVFTVEDALAAGMITRIGTMAETLDRVLHPAAAGTPTPTHTPAAATGQEPDSATPQERAAYVRDILELQQLSAEWGV